MKLSARLRAHDWTAALIELLIVIDGARKEATRLAADVEKARVR